MTKGFSAYVTAPPRALTYEEARDLAASRDLPVRQGLARREDLPGEILYYLTKDSDPSVRRIVAANPSMPAKGNLLLVDDPDENVRAELAAKVARLQKGQSSDKKKSSIAAEVLDRLTRDNVCRVRAIIADALKDVVDGDRELITRLARDAEIIVAAPILEYSPVLTDQDLLDIIAGSPIQGALAAISRRAYVDYRVTEAIVATNNSQAITYLLKNANAHLQENTLNSLIERSAHEPMWQEPLVYRPGLTEQSVLRLSQIVASHLLNRLLAREDLSADAIQAVAEVVGRRLKEQEEIEGRAKTKIAFSSEVESRYAPYLEKARAAFEAGETDEMPLIVSLATGYQDDVIAALAIRSSLSVQSVLDIVAAQSPRATCALAWAAGFSAGFAVELQYRLVGLPLEKVLKPGKGGNYVLRDDEMRWQLAMY